MKTSFYLTVNSSGSTRTTKKSPDLKWDEVTIHLQLDLPNQLFYKPRLNARIEVAEEDIMPIDIPTEVIDNINEIIASQTGMEVKISLVKPEAETP